MRQSEVGCGPAVDMVSVLHGQGHWAPTCPAPLYPIKGACKFFDSPPTETCGLCFLPIHLGGLWPMRPPTD